MLSYASDCGADEPSGCKSAKASHVIGRHEFDQIEAHDAGFGRDTRHEVQYIQITEPTGLRNDDGRDHARIKSVAIYGDDTMYAFRNMIDNVLDPASPESTGSNNCCTPCLPILKVGLT